MSPLIVIFGFMDKRSGEEKDFTTQSAEEAWIYAKTYNCTVIARRYRFESSQVIRTKDAALEEKDNAERSF